jgi:transcriptional regulator with XRE-family HTH domain
LRKASTNAGRPSRAEAKAFGRVLAEARQHEALSQETLAFEAGYHPKYVSILERGLSSPSLTAIMRLAAVLKVPGSELVHRVELAMAKMRKGKKSED